MFQIVTDTREQHPFSFEGYPVEVKPRALPTGDYSLDGFEDRIAIERKAAGDLLSCMTGGRERFTRELERLRGYEAAAVVVELYLRVNTVNFILVNAACCLLVTGMDFLFYYLMPSYPGATGRFLTQVLPMVIYTAALSPLSMMAVRWVAGRFVPEQ